MFAFSVSNSGPLSLCNCVLSRYTHFSLAVWLRSAHSGRRMRWGGGVVFSLDVDVYQSFPSLYTISGLALLYGSLGSLSRLAVLSYPQIAILCGLDHRCLLISQLLCNGLSSRMATSMSHVEPCRMAIYVTCFIDRCGISQLKYQNVQGNVFEVLC